MIRDDKQAKTHKYCSVDQTKSTNKLYQHAKPKEIKKEHKNKELNKRDKKNGRTITVFVRQVQGERRETGQ